MLGCFPQIKTISVKSENILMLSLFSLMAQNKLLDKWSSPSKLNIFEIIFQENQYHNELIEINLLLDKSV